MGSRKAGKEPYIAGEPPYIGVTLLPKEHPLGRVDIFYKYLGEYLPEVGETIEVRRYFDGPTRLAVVTRVDSQGITAQELEPNMRGIAPAVTRPDIEEAILRAFIRPERADRYVAQLKKKMRRERLRFDLHNLFDLDGRWIRWLSREEDNPRALYALLRKLGAPEDCYVMSGGYYDGADVELLEALNEVHATGMGTIVSCVHGKLAYYEGETERFILERP